MRRFETVCKIVLVAVVMLTAAGTPAAARPPMSVDIVVRVEKGFVKKKSFFSAWLKNMREKLTRYAMAAN